MNEQVKEYLDKYSGDIINMFNDIRQLLMNMEPLPEERLWAKLPSYYVGESYVRLIPFKDHINIEAKAIPQFMDELVGYKVTPKGMLQIYFQDNVPSELLQRIFEATLR